MGSVLRRLPYEISFQYEYPVLVWQCPWDPNGKDGWGSGRVTGSVYTPELVTRSIKVKSTQTVRLGTVYRLRCFYKFGYTVQCACLQPFRVRVVLCEVGYRLSVEVFLEIWTHGPMCLSPTFSSESVSLSTRPHDSRVTSHRRCHGVGFSGTSSHGLRGLWVSHFLPSSPSHSYPSPPTPRTPSPSPSHLTTLRREPSDTLQHDDYLVPRFGVPVRGNCVVSFVFKVLF